MPRIYAEPNYPWYLNPVGGAPTPAPGRQTLTVGTTAATIQGTLDLAQPGDVVVVPPGTYGERFTTDHRIPIYLQPGANIEACTAIHAYIRNSKSRIGVNLDSTKEYQYISPWRDYFKTARFWEVPGLGQSHSLILDSNGWITNFNGHTSAETYVWADNAPTGQFVVLWDGSPAAFANNWLQPMFCDLISESGNRAVIQINTPNSNVGLRLRPGAPQYIRNLRVLKPADEATYAAQPWNPDYLSYLAPFGTIRFMDWFKTNDSPLTQWSDRIPKTFAFQNGDYKGVAYEWAIELCNLLDCDLWATVPHRFQQADMQQMASLIHANLNSDLKCYVEFSNEAWNGQFQQFHYCRAQGLAQGLSGDQNLAAFYFYAQQSDRAWTAFKQTFTNPARVIRIYGGQVANPYVAEQGMLWLQANAGGMKADMMAIAPYFDGTSPIPGVGSGYTIAGIPGGNYAEWNGSAWVDLGTTSPGGSISTNWNGEPPSSPSNGQRWRNTCTNVMALNNKPDWADTNPKIAYWENAILALTETQLLAAIAHDIANHRTQQIQSNITMLQSHSWTIPLCCYEAGQHLQSAYFTSGSNRDTMYARLLALQDKLGPSIQAYLDMWLTVASSYAGGTGLLNWFTLSATPSIWGYWGLLPNDKKYLAVTNWMHNHPQG